MGIQGHFRITTLAFTDGEVIVRPRSPGRALEYWGGKGRAIAVVAPASMGGSLGPLGSRGGDAVGPQGRLERTVHGGRLETMEQQVDRQRVLFVGALAKFCTNAPLELNKRQRLGVATFQG